MIEKLDDLTIGDKVHYIPDHEGAEAENGIVKDKSPSVSDCVWVVYNCADDWDNYRNYTGAMTNLKYLHHGWGNDES